jgi:hypothetical protein
VKYDLTEIGLNKIIEISQEYVQKAIEIKNIAKSYFQKQI